ncbi:MAG: LysM peptidoglycan-binding domain-containing protein, partial [Ilumatobacteraceae bacterium]
TAVNAAAHRTTAEPSTLVYTVRNGDYLFRIAVTLGVPVSDLLAVNKLTMTSSIHPGDKLAVPVGGALPVESSPAALASPTPAPALALAASSYIVKNGDSFFRIAAKSGVTLTALLVANSMTVTTPIFPGTNLVLPPATLSIPTPAAPATPAAAPVAAPAPAAAVAAPTAGPMSAYTVKNGDYLVGIAASTGVTLKALLAANTMTVASAIFPGDTLVVPPPTLPIPAPTAPAAPAPSAAPGPIAQQTSIATVVAFLKGEVGKPYLFNTAGPDAYDCSGLVVAAYRQIGVELPHQSLLLSQKGVSVDWHAVDIQAGDLIFQIGTGKSIISHVGIAVSSTQWIQSARTGDFVKIRDIPSDDKIQAVRRIVS